VIAATDPTLKAAEDELQVRRGRDALISGFIHNPAYDRDSRIALARLLDLPRPGNDTRKDTSHGG
jgi:hypothetical protein